MGLTGVIYAAIVVAWAIFLVPLALRRHDQTARNRSIERFSSSMRVLSTGSRDRASSRAVVTPTRQDDDPVPGIAPPVHGASVAVRPVSRAQLRAAAARRRRVLRTLVALTCLTGAVCVLGVVPPWSFAVPLVVIAAFLVIARHQVRVANKALSQRAAANARVASSSVTGRSDAVHDDAAHAPARSGPRLETTTDRSDGGSGSEAEGDPSDDEPTITLSAAQLAAAAHGRASGDRVAAGARSTSDGSSLWDPLPVTLPSYVDKPVVRRTVRKVAIGESGKWSAGHASAAPPVAGATAAHSPANARGGSRQPAQSGDETEETSITDAGATPRAANA